MGSYHVLLILHPLGVMIGAILSVSLQRFMPPRTLVRRGLLALSVCSIASAVSGSIPAASTFVALVGTFRFLLGVACGANEVSAQLLIVRMVQIERAPALLATVLAARLVATVCSPRELRPSNAATYLPPLLDAIRPSPLSPSPYQPL